MLSIFILIPWITLSNNIEQKKVTIDNNNIGYFQSNTCTLSLSSILYKNLDNFDLEFLPDKSSEIKCHGKINGVDFIEDNIKVYIGTNNLVDLLYQSLFWIICISLIPKDKKSFKFKYKTLNTILIIFLIIYHLYSESNYYNSFSKNFNLKLNLDNYYLLSAVIILYLIINLLIDVLEKRHSNIINYLPYIFLVSGTFNSFNFNIFLVVLSLLGLNSFFEKKIDIGLQLLYIATSFVIIANYLRKSSDILYFDVDKLKGFTNSTNTYNSVIFWIIIYGLVIQGMIYLINENKNFFNFITFRNNLLIVGGLINLFGLFSALHPIINFSTYYYFGLNKQPIKTLTSVDGNTWRGLSSSAESLGEFYAFVILFSILLFLIKPCKLSKFQIVLLLTNLFGLILTNNAAAMLSMLLITVLGIINIKFKISKKNRFILYFLGLLFLLFIFNAQNTYSKDYLSNSLIRYGLENSKLEYDFPLDQNNETAIERLSFGEILNLKKENLNISNSLYFVIEKYNDENNIKNIPNVVTVIGTIATTINRSEKWGIFLAKYDPTLLEIIFGYGPNQLTEYYLSHITKVNTGLVLPHSSLLILQLSFGIFGILLIFIYLTLKILKNYENNFYFYLQIFMIMNLLKSDSILYVNSFLLLLLSINFYKLEINKNE